TGRGDGGAGLSRGAAQGRRDRGPGPHRCLAGQAVPRRHGRARRQGGHGRRTGVLRSGPRCHRAGRAARGLCAGGRRALRWRAGAPRHRLSRHRARTGRLTPMVDAPVPDPVPDRAPVAPRVPHIAPEHLGKLRRLFACLQAISPALAARVAFRMFLRTFRRPVAAEDRAALDRARRHQLMAGPDPMTVYEWGDGERTVIILHGWGSGAARFTRLAEALQARGWRVLVPDAPGHGASPGRSSSLPQFIVALDAIVARFGPPQALVGHSLGALGIAHRHAAGLPDWADQLESVVLISMPSGAP